MIQRMNSIFQFLVLINLLIGTKTVHGSDSNDQSQQWNELQTLLNNAESIIKEHDSTTWSVLTTTKLETITSSGTTSSTGSSKNNNIESSGVGGGIIELQTIASTLTKQYQKMNVLQKQQYELMNQMNLKQLHDFIQTLKTIGQQYHDVEQEKQKQKEEENVLVLETDEDDLSTNNGTITTTTNMLYSLDDLYDLFHVDTTLNESETTMYEHIIDLTKQHMNTILHETLDKVPKDVKESIMKLTATNKKKNKKKSTSTTTTTSCLEPVLVAQEIHTALIKYRNDRIGIKDILQDSGTSIVYEMTSPTYQNQYQPHSQQHPTREVMTLGTVWWNKYIPYEIEQYILPKGWENIVDPITSFIIPMMNQWFRYFHLPNPFSFFMNLYQYYNHHNNNQTGVQQQQQSSSSTTTISTSLNLPPETIFHPNDMPGSCWPMVGTNGYVTIRLPYLLSSIDSITIDHVTDFIIMDPNESLQSAPKYVNVYAFSPSKQKDSNGLGFDVSSKHLLTIQPILYDKNHIPGMVSSVQTFPIDTNENHMEIGNNNKGDVEEEEEEEDDGTCSPTKPTCGAPQAKRYTQNENTGIAAIQIEILNNWGNDDYTCLYRIRVHGDPM